MKDKIFKLTLQITNPVTLKLLAERSPRERAFNYCGQKGFTGSEYKILIVLKAIRTEDNFIWRRRGPGKYTKRFQQNVPTNSVNLEPQDFFVNRIEENIRAELSVLNRSGAWYRVRGVLDNGIKKTIIQEVLIPAGLYGEEEFSFIHWINDSLDYAKSAEHLMKLLRKYFKQLRKN